MKASYTIVCPHCGGPTERNEKWDAYCCMECNVWLENKCAGPNSKEPYGGCYFSCWNRPEAPR